jgi:hypothetical protein
VADNITIPAEGNGSTTPVVATDDVGGIHYQRFKLDLGGDGLAVPAVGTVPVSGTVTASGPLTDAQLRAVAVPVSGTVTVSGAVTAAQPAATSTTVNARQTVPTTVLGTEILPADGARKGLAVMPEAAMHISFGEDTTTSHFQVQAFQVFQPPVGVNITGQVKGLSAAGSITVNVLAW